MLLNGSEILIQCLIEQGVDTIFGYPGGAVLNIYDALYKYRNDIRHVLTCHEQGASHAADGYARSTGKVGVCLATSGPGATNLVTGIATAYMDSIPMVAITGNVTRPLLGKDSFQEVDITGITLPITKHNFMVRDINELADIIREAFRIAQEGRPGPVLVDIPKDISAQKGAYIKQEPVKVKRKTEFITDKALDEVAKLINQSSKPFIYAGGGIIRADASEELMEFAEKIDSPTATSLMCMGGFPVTHPLFTGMIGMHGTKASNLGAWECDLLIAIGSRFSDRVISSNSNLEGAKIIHLDVDPAEINKNVKVDASVIGDVRETLRKLIPLVEKKNNNEWTEKIKGYKDSVKNLNSKKEELTPEFLFEKINDLTNGEAIITTEVGQHQMWASQFYKHMKPKRFVTSGGLGTMGFGLGAAIGSKVGNPDKLVINIAGDGSFAMNCNELATAYAQKAPVITIIVNNNALGMVRQWQNFFYEERYSHTSINRGTNFVKLVEAYGGKGYLVEKREELEPVLKEAINSSVPVVIDYRVHEDKKVFPMVAPGALINQIIYEEDV
ncbi:biosynthetic-type acetolactate synthase large subunit [Clostridium intestinale]|uniref:Acetolactate synthase n=1 Tax=Clostridium intestinale DSM 6191 TaxID=1121320 RepID=A0A1M5ZVI1_9CLOT|nr:biosynthetic-type acetolactate synthase large subunit [Clostridium intestinale]SHI27943.1 acetolactate synthase, large subunit [Clostridium intestinale DSM 6191]